MKNLTSKILMALVVTGFTGVAHANIASKTYVDNQNTAQTTSIEAKIGTLANLTTTQKANVVVAINEIKSILGTLDSATVADLITETDADGKYAVKSTEGVASDAAGAAAANATAIGKLADLDTTAQGNLVAAINEIKGILGNVSAADIADLITETDADLKYASIETEGVASDAADAAAANATAIGIINTTLAGKEDKSKLKALAYKDTVVTTDIVDKNVTKAKLADDVQASLGKADSALQAASIAGLATKTELTTGLAGKQATLTTAQQNAVDSGITTAKVTAYDNYATTKADKSDLTGLASEEYVDTEVAKKQATLTTAQLAAVDSGITTAKVATYDAYNAAITGKADKSTTYTKTEVDTALTGKQATLTTAQQNAVNSGITTAKVTSYDNTVTEVASLGALAKAAPGACGSAANKCVLVFDGTTYSWEVIER